MECVFFRRILFVDKGVYGFSARDKETSPLQPVNMTYHILRSYCLWNNT